MIWLGVEGIRMNSGESGGGRSCIVIRRGKCYRRDSLSHSLLARDHCLLIYTLAMNPSSLSRRQPNSGVIDGQAHMLPLHQKVSPLARHLNDQVHTVPELVSSHTLGPVYSLAYHAGSFRLSVAIIVIVSEEVQHVTMHSQHENAYINELTFQMEQHV